ncbi:MAG: hypothetical protein B7Z37_16705 [Verrucomicrobia bacterium 12-59-8]|nr:MAG: hypothetical protein B7Z37_16705 [Verrucomicrobia bacterium 12-59-8]
MDKLLKNIGLFFSFCVAMSRRAYHWLMKKDGPVDHVRIFLAGEKVAHFKAAAARQMQKWIQSPWFSKARGWLLQFRHDFQRVALPWLEKTWRILVEKAREILAREDVKRMLDRVAKTLQRWSASPRFWVGLGAVLLVWGWSGKHGRVSADEAQRHEVRSEFEMPDLKAPVLAKPDQVAVEFKLAVAQYESARTQARAELGTELRGWVSIRREELHKNAATSADSQRMFDKLEQQWERFCKSSSGVHFQGSVPQLKTEGKIVEKYWRALEEAARNLGAVSEKGLATYQQQGVTDPACLRPLQARVLAAQHPELLGIWESDDKSPLGQYDVWSVAVDETTGTWRIEGTYNADRSTSAGTLQFGQDIKFKDGDLSFMAHGVDNRTRKPLPEGKPVTFALQSTTLLHRGLDGSGNQHTLGLHRSGNESALSMIRHWGVPLEVPKNLIIASETPDVTDASYVWRRIAGLASFPVYRKVGGLEGPQTLYMSYRSSHVKLPTNALGGLGMLFGLGGMSDDGGSVKEILKVQADYLPLFDSPSPYLRRAAGAFLSATMARMEVAQVNEDYGNTASSSIFQFQNNALAPAIRYAFAQDADRHALREQLQRQYPNRSVTVLDAPMSESTSAQLDQMVSGAANIRSDMDSRAGVSGMLVYDDMAQADLMVSLWQTWLMPLAERSAGRTSSASLTSMEGDWSPDNSGHPGLTHFLLRNTSKQDLTHVVVEVTAETEWGDQNTQYYYLSQFGLDEAVSLGIHPRLRSRRLPFSNDVTIRWSLWSDQGRELQRQCKTTNPRPIPDTQTLRGKYLGFDEDFQAAGEALGYALRKAVELPFNTDVQRRRLLELVSPPASYAMLIEKGGRPQVVKFTSLDHDKGNVETEITDMENRKPFFQGKSTVTGVLTQLSNAVWVINFDGGMQIGLHGSDRFSLYLPKEGDRTARLLPLARITPRR